MKKTLLTTGIVLFMGSMAIAQQPAKAVAKKKFAVANIDAKATQVSSQTEQERVKAKQKHFQEMQAQSSNSTPAKVVVPVDDKTGARKKKSNG